MSIRVAVGLLAAAVAALLLAWGVWLLVTPDPDGGKRGGALEVLGLALPVAAATSWSLLRRRRSQRQP